MIYTVPISQKESHYMMQQTMLVVP